MFAKKERQGGQVALNKFLLLLAAALIWGSCPHSADAKTAGSATMTLYVSPKGKGQLDRAAGRPQ